MHGHGIRDVQLPQVKTPAERKFDELLAKAYKTTIPWAQQQKIVKLIVESYQTGLQRGKEIYTKK